MWGNAMVWQEPGLGSTVVLDSWEGRRLLSGSAQIVAGVASEGLGAVCVLLPLEDTRSLGKLKIVKKPVTKF